MAEGKDVVQFLARMSLFEGLSTPDLERLAELATKIQAQPGEILLEENRVGDEVFAIMHGRVDIKVMLPGVERTETIAELKDGEIVGETVLLGKSRRIAYVQARDNVYALKWNREDLLEEFQRDASMGYVIMRNLARILLDRLTATNMTLRNAFNRIVDIL